jgi:hypothetical protein
LVVVGAVDQTNAEAAVCVNGVAEDGIADAAVVEDTVASPAV